MKKFNSVIFNKLLLQAEEAEYQGLNKLATALHTNLKPYLNEENSSSEYSMDEMKQEIYNNLWAAASSIIKYYDVQSVDAIKVHAAIEEMTENMLQNIKNSIEVSSTFGPLEPKTPGETE